MRNSLGIALLAVGGVALAPPAEAQNVGAAPPVIEAVKWYNTPPLALENLQGKAVLVEVFRTW